MKKVIFIFVFTLLWLVTKAQQTPYYFYNYAGEKVYFSLNTQHAFLSLKEQRIPESIQQRSVRIAELKSDKSDTKQYQNQSGTRRFYTVLTFEENMPEEQYLRLLSDIKRQNSDVIISPYFKGKDDDFVGLSNFFYVKLKEERDTSLLIQMTKETGTVIIEQDTFMPLWYVLSTTEISEHNALDCSNLFYESGLFQTAEPDLMLNLLQCVNDTHFNNQWGLRNTGQNGGTNGVDIRACDAWQISTGHNVIIAVVDEGIELNHPDLATNIHPLSYDTENRSSPSIVRGSHGVACAGIAGAIQNNSQGISGVAPNCQLMSISRYLGNGSAVEPLVRQDLAAGINWAWLNGADVISNSWGHTLLQGTFITDAINNAVTLGRNGLGCVVVFAAGNDNASTVSYPASLANVIAVGAISPCGQRKSPTSCDGETNWGSNYGTDLDVVAPGVLIPTTDRQGNNGYNYVTSNTNDPAYSDYPNKDYTGRFNGTSAACPHVAGVAALILSVRPDLTQAQVRNAIETTCNKSLPGWSVTQTRPNGTWNNQLGYGLVNAYAAVDAVMPTITGSSTVCTSSNYTLNHNVSATWSVTPSGTFSISGSNVGNSVNVTSYNMAGATGTLTATLAGGATVTKTIKSCQASISGSDKLCPNTTNTYTITGIPQGLTPSSTVWSGFGLTLSSQTLLSTNASTTTVIPLIVATYPLPPIVSGSLLSSISAKVTINSTISTLSKGVTIGNPPGAIVGPMNLGGSIVIMPTQPGYYKFTVGTDVPSNATVRWVAAPVNSTDPNATADLYTGRTVNIYLDWGLNEVRMQYTTIDCGNSIPAVMTVAGGYRGGFSPQDSASWDTDNNPCLHDYIVYPNPVSTELIIDKIEDLDNDCEPAKSKSTIKVLLYSHSTTKLVFSQDYPSSTKQIKIDTSKLPDGVYYLNIIENGEKIKKQTIIVNH